MGDEILCFALAILFLTIALYYFVQWWPPNPPALPRLDTPPPSTIDPQRTAATLKKYEQAQAEAERTRRGEP